MQNIAHIFITLALASATDVYDDHKGVDEYKYPFVPYGFGYEIVDDYGNKNYRREEGQNENHIVGSYGFQDNDGIMRHVEYIADKEGFRAQIKTNEPGTANSNPAAVKMNANPIHITETQKYSKQIHSHDSGSHQSSHHPSDIHESHSNDHKYVDTESEHKHLESEKIIS